MVAARKTGIIFCQIRTTWDDVLGTHIHTTMQSFDFLNIG